jgi:hypothetical protein
MHEIACRLHATDGKGHCDCQATEGRGLEPGSSMETASAADDRTHGEGAWPTSVTRSLEMPETLDT